MDWATAFAKGAEQRCAKDHSEGSMQLKATVGHYGYDPYHSFVLTVTPVAGGNGGQRQLIIRYNDMQFRPVCAEDTGAIDRVLAHVMGIIANGGKWFRDDLVRPVMKKLHASWRGKYIAEAAWESQEDLQKMLSNYVHMPTVLE